MLGEDAAQLRFDYASHMWLDEDLAQETTLSEEEQAALTDEDLEKLAGMLAQLRSEIDSISVPPLFAGADPSKVIAAFNAIYNHVNGRIGPLIAQKALAEIQAHQDETGEAFSFSDQIDWSAVGGVAVFAAAVLFEPVDWACQI